MQKLAQTLPTEHAAQAPVFSAAPQSPTPKANDLFGLGEKELGVLIKMGRAMHYAKGDVLVAQGDVHDGIIFILGGRVRSFYVSSRGQEMTLAYWPAGHFVGAPQILGGGEHMWTAIAEAPTRGVLLSGTAVRKILHTQPNLAVALVECLVFKSRCYTAMLQMVGTQSKTARLAHVLLNLAVKDDETGRWVQPAVLTHFELAKMIGATRQSVSHSLDRFERDGLIDRASGSLVIADRRKLRQLCD